MFAGLPAIDPATGLDNTSLLEAGSADPYPSVATAGVDNFSSTDTNSFTASTAQTIYDSLGNPHTLSLYFVKTGQPGSWQMYSTIDNIAAPAPGSVTGSSVLGSPPSSLDISAANNNNVFDIAVDGGPTLSVTIADGPYPTATALVNAVNAALQNVAGTVVDDTGAVYADADGVNLAVGASARLDAFDHLIITSNTVNVGSSCVITENAALVAAGTPTTTVTALFGAQPSTVAGGPAKVDTLLFKPDGSLVTTNPVTESFTLYTGATSPLQFTVDLKGSSQYGISFGVNQLLQDGYTSGKISGLSVSADGIVQGNYSNGKSRNLGQIVLATFTNPNGLQSMGGNQWAETADSGQPIPGTPGSGSLGTVQSGAIEESNVDLTAELVQMITQQRAYQANAQTIKTIDQVLQTLVNLR
ncbi:MAG: flagellar hook-basal body complex protein [Betaproteobacteria bacterium]|nr:flagellar hook-basal body complex protein [Betaproteobacteria bacterium]